MIGTQLFCLLGLLVWQLAATVTGNPIPSEDRGLKVITNHKRFYNYTQGKIRGVNLGGWLLLEPFITPSLFEAFRTNPNNDDGIPVDEYEFCQKLGKELARDRLVAHWNTFYKEQDFIDIAAKGLNLVRIPVGYWAFALRENDPFVTGEQEFFLDRAIEWARKAGLKVWVDLHGAAGSQNGFDNSGWRDHLEFLDEKNMAVTKKALFHIMEKYSRDEYSDTVVGIQVLNEPLGTAVDMEKVKALYNDAYNYLRYEIKRDAMMVIHDAFQPAGYWDNFMTVDQGFWGVVVDHHHYHVFSTGELDTTIDQKIATACNWGSSAANEYHWTVHGEWSAALTDCTKWLNGVGRGARYDGTFHKDNESSYYIGSCEGSQDIANWPEEKKVNTRRWIEAQLDAYELKNGWIFWTWKTEGTGEWDLQRLMYHRLFPQPLNERLYPNPCGAKN